MKSNLPLNQILQGDCIQILKSLPEKSVDLIFADPPYNLQLQQELRRPNRTVVDAVDDEWDKFADFAEYDVFTRAWLGECRRVLKDNGTIWVIGSYHNIFRVGTVLMDLGYWILNSVEWVKSNPMPNFRGTRFTNATETLIWAKKSAEQKKYTFNYHAMKHLNEDKQMQNVWQIPLCTGAERLKIDGKKAHSTQKPEALLYRVLMSSSNPGDIVLDPFFGSGTTGAVAKKLQRHFIGIEMETAYVNVARQRIESIPEPTADDTLLITPSKRAQPRIAFSRLIEAGYLQPGQTLYSKDRQYCAVIHADSYLITGEFSGSIHQVAAQVQGMSNFNGWEFWFYEDQNGDLASIDVLRERYRKEVFSNL
ncbi:MAG: site-specific DNA-methyltransferase [Chitinophagaceae bacterium]|nr:site-specific DNA-methyltransferase [Anaerolineae bacterium]